jgi:hypothetical protein
MSVKISHERAIGLGTPGIDISASTRQLIEALR